MTRPFASLRNRIFLACLVVSVLSVVVTSRFVTTRLTAQADADLRRDVSEAADLLDRQYRTRLDEMSLMAQLIADLPKLKAAVATGDAPTVRPIAEDYHRRVGSDLFEVVGADGGVLAALGGTRSAPTVEVPRDGSRTGLLSSRDATWLVATAPITVGPEPVEVLGAMSLGFAIDAGLARRLGSLTDSHVAFLVGDTLAGSSLAGYRPAQTDASLPDAVAVVDGEEFVIEARELQSATDGGPVLTAFVLRSRTERLELLRSFQTGLLLAALVAAALAAAMSYLVARSVTRPLNAITARMSEMAATGDLSRKIEIRGGWDDEDARLLAGTFNSLTDSIRHFQHESAQKGRLQALGRLSTVIAHEVRNPLMIIKAALRTLRREKTGTADGIEAVEEIDQEVARLDRIVADVLDFARPVRLDLSQTDVGRLCEDAAAAVRGEGSGIEIAVAVREGLKVVTDSERLRTVLVNVVQNAREAVLEKGSRAGGAPGEAGVPVVDVAAMSEGDRIVIEISDPGVGIPHDAQPHIFDPYLTTKRTGTGLGLAISKNIVESLGGRLLVESEPSRGTQVRIELRSASASERT